MRWQRRSWLGLLAALSAPVIASEPRLTAAQAPAAWQASVVRIAVPVSRLEGPHRRHYVEDCSGTVVSLAGELRILTAWHCFDGVDTTGRRKPVLALDSRTLPVQLLQSGGSITNDWALLAPSEAAQALLPAPLPLVSRELQPGERVLMAGFSRDPGLGAGGATLTFDPDCQITAVHSDAVSTDCAAHKGASGGPVLLAVPGGWAVTGVISRGDGAGTSLYAPIPLHVAPAYPRGAESSD